MLQIFTTPRKMFLISWCSMTDLAHLKSLIATFAGDASSEVDHEEPSNWRDAFVKVLVGTRFDAVQVTGGQVSKTYGTAQDIILFSKNLADEGSTDARLFVYTCPANPSDVLFCASREAETIVIRAQSANLNKLLHFWSSTPPS